MFAIGVSCAADCILADTGDRFYAVRWIDENRK